MYDLLKRVHSQAADLFGLFEAPGAVLSALDHYARRSLCGSWSPGYALPRYDGPAHKCGHEFRHGHCCCLRYHCLCHGQRCILDPFSRGGFATFPNNNAESLTILLSPQLTFMPDSEALRLGSALVMGLAVCATHYSGMGAATYTASEENYADSTRLVLDGKIAADVASNGALLLCYWLASFGVVRSARMADRSNPRSGKSAIHEPKTSMFKPSAGRQSEVRHAPEGTSGTRSGSGVRRVFVSPAQDPPV